MAFCKKCGNEIATGEEFCRNCGTQVIVSTWDGSVFDTIINSIIASLIIGCTFGIATPWAICYMMKFVIGHTVIGGRRLSFDGNGTQLFGNWIKWFFLSVITIGIYALWLPIKVRKWRAKHTTATKVESKEDEYAYPQPQVTFYTYPQN